MVEVIVSADNLETLDWSPWLDFDRSKIASIPDSSVGVYKMHESMKILYIGSSQNLKTLDNLYLIVC